MTHTLAQLLAIAVTAWSGATPACGSVDIHEQALTPDRIGESYLAPIDPAYCVIRIDPRANTYSEGERCIIVTHEYGHLLGEGHVTGDNVMNPNRTNPANVEGCWRLDHPIMRIIPKKVKRHAHSHHRHHHRHTHTQSRPRA